MRMLPDYLIPVSPDQDLKIVANLQMLHESFILVGHETANYLEKLLKRPTTSGNQLNILQSQHFSDLLNDL